MSVRVNVQDRVMRITLDAPDVLNALDWESWGTLSNAWTELDRDDDIWLGVITGTGVRAFCSGADMRTLPAEVLRRRDAGLPADPPRAFVDDYNSKPVLCAINGTAQGLGLEIALACDVRITVDHARFGLPEGTFGGLAGAGGTTRLPRAIGMTRALDMLLTGRTISATEALEWGLVSSVVTSAELQDATDRLIEQVMCIAPLAARNIKRSVYEGAAQPVQEAMKLEKQLSAALKDSHDIRVGLEAKRTKTRPVWTGR